MFPIILGGLPKKRAVAPWNPGDLPGLAATLLPAESRSAGLLWQNTAKTVAATADGDPVRVAVCPYTGVEFTAPSDAARPLLWDEGSGKWSLSFDGVDDYFGIPASLLSAVPGFTFGVRVRPNAAVSSLQTILGFTDSGVNGPSQLRATTGAVWDSTLQSGFVPLTLTGGLVSAVYTTVTSRYRSSTHSLRVNGTSVGSAASSGTFTVSAGTFRIMANPFAGRYFPGRLAGVALYEVGQTDNDVMLLETYLGAL